MPVKVIQNLRRSHHPIAFPLSRGRELKELIAAPNMVKFLEQRRLNKGSKMRFPTRLKLFQTVLTARSIHPAGQRTDL